MAKTPKLDELEQSLTQEQGEKKEVDLKRQRDGTELYRVGEVGPKGQSILRSQCSEGDEIYLTPGEVSLHREHGVPLIKVDVNDRASDV